MVQVRPLLRPLVIAAVALISILTAPFALMCYAVVGLIVWIR